MTPLALWRHEVRRTGWAAPVTLSVCAAFVVLLAVLQAGGGNDVATARTLQAVLEMGMPLAAGVVAASLVGRDVAVELQASVFREYRSTLLRRLVITFGWTAVIAGGTSVALTVSGWWHRWPLAPAPALGQLVWLAPTLCLAGLGFLLGALLRSPAAAGGLVAAVWLVQQLLADAMRDWTPTQLMYLFATTRGSDVDWLANRLVLLASGVALLVAGWLVLARAERLVRGEDG
ncbi:hypothetical protein [Actinophytocola sediminis]